MPLLPLLPPAAGRRRLAALAAAVAVLPSALSFASPAHAAPAALTPAVAALAERAPQQRTRVIVQQLPGADVTAAVVAAGGTVERRVELIDALAVRVSAAGAARIAAADGVRAVSLDAPIARTAAESTDAASTAAAADAASLATAYPQAIHADEAWDRDVTGRGIGVAVIDTGIQGDLTDFQVSRRDRRSRVVASAVVNPGAATAADGFGHGTHVAGLIAGNGFNRAQRDPLDGRYVGIAPEAQLISVKAGDEAGGATVLDVIDGLQFVVDQRRRLGIRVVNLSLSSAVAESHLTDPLDAAVEAAWLKGLVVVAAAGNRGAAEDAVDYAPANDPWIIAVGGSDDHGTKRTGDDDLAAWSSRGATQDGYAKPDVVAPGAHLVSTIPAGSAYTLQCPLCLADGSYFRVGGTSMAAGVASGAVALVLQAHPDWTPDEVKAALVERARPLAGAGTAAAGQIAVERLVRSGTSAPRPANAGLTVSSLVDPATGDLDFTRTSWTRTSWTEAVDPLRTSWTQSDWMRTSWTRTSWTASEATCSELERTSWTRTSWTAAELAGAHAQCDALLASVDPTRTSWTRTSWTRTSWTASFTK